MHYRTAITDVLDSVTPFHSKPMDVVTITGVAGQSLVQAAAVIPAEVADTRGVDYFIAFTDGATTTYWPGTSHVDGYVPVEGTRVGYHHVRVLESPQVVHVPTPVAPALRDLRVETIVSCATEVCDVSLHYRRGWDELGDSHVMPMMRVGDERDTPFGRAATYQAVIPAAEVTTTQLSYWVRAHDGFTQGFAPGTPYQGAYSPTEAAPAGAFLVRVLEPAHVVHVPPIQAASGGDLPLQATSNCATTSCEATLHWRIIGDPEWTSVTMGHVRTPVESTGQATMQYSASIPGASVTPAGLEHWIEVTDGYVSEQTPIWPTVVR